MLEVRSTPKDLIFAGFCGVTRAAVVQALITPLSVVNIRYQATDTSSTILEIAREILRKEGTCGLYSGFSLKLAQTLPKQICYWPMMMHIPKMLERYFPLLSDTQKQATTGLSIAFVDATFTTPLERGRVRAAFTGQSCSITDVYKEGWRGYGTHLARLSVNWMAFLAAQKYFRNQALTESNKQLSLCELAKIGAKVGLFVSLVAAPFDYANTLRQSRDLSVFSQGRIFRSYKGWPISAVALMIQNIASVGLIDRLEYRSRNTKTITAPSLA